MADSEQLMEEGLVAATAAARQAGLRVSVWTILRWIRRGVRAGRLEAVKIGGRWFTSVAAIRRFVGRCGQCAGVAAVAASGSSKGAERYLSSIGLGREPGKGAERAKERRRS